LAKIAACVALIGLSSEVVAMLMRS
jgi:hypothetical protein